MKRFLLTFFLVVIIIFIHSYQCCFAQYTYTTNPVLTYQNSYATYPDPYATYPSSNTWAGTIGGYTGSYSQAAPYNSYVNPYSNPFISSYAYSYPYTSSNPLNPYLSYNPYGTYGYAPSAYNPFTVYGDPYSQTGAYNAGYYSPNNTTDPSGSGTYNAQATSYYNSIYPNVTNPLQLNPFVLSNIIAPYIASAYQNPSAYYLPAQGLYQYPYTLYPYGSTQPAAINPYQGYTTSPYVPTYPYTQTDPYSQTNSYSQPLPYYQTNYTQQATTQTTATAQATQLIINGKWTGNWFTTLPSGEVNTGEATLSINQAGAELTGTITFVLNGYPKLSSNVNGTITGSAVSLVGSLFNGNNIYSLSFKGNVTANNISGSYTITNNSGTIVESGTYNLVRTL